ncbi:myTH4 domain protein [Teladorsagia circumcincta]|uniref:MyTH4 domain protein n=1 Tax=Teladorsagia circumcincta TaxID=45464 RepID=A0A2G9URV4_TELCI|nr:myTH4 domain protein [Teladorsagia circumcincta]
MCESYFCLCYHAPVLSLILNLKRLQVGQLFDFLPPDSRLDTIPDNVSSSSISIDSNPTQIPAVEKIVQVEEDLGKYQFSKFAATYFQSQITSSHSKKPLKSPLLTHEDSASQLAAMAVWITILRFMGDLPDVKYNSNNGEVLDKTPIMSRLFESLGRKYTARDVEEAAQAEDIDGTDMSSSSSERSTDSSTSSNALMENRPMSSLDKLHYIIGMGILREELRDEIYCQLCKQLTGNPSRLSAARGWILLSLCVGCFAPSPRFIKYLYCFIRERGPAGAGYAAYMEERLRRTEQNGCRHQPPSYVELQANKAKKQIVLAVTLMDGSVKTMSADSATTAAEVCSALAEKIGLRERFGFSLYIALFDKVSSLGSGVDHVMDAISQCEQYAKEQGRQERNAPWRLFFRKEIFTPWHDAKDDPTSTNLIYQQVVRGIKYGEYRCDKEDDLASLAAQQYFIEEGLLDVNRLESQLHNYLPDFELNGKEMAKERWIQAIMYHYRRKFGTNPPSPHHVKEDVVTFAKFKWPLLFSRGPRPGADACVVQTVTGDEYSFQSPNAEDVKDLVSTFIDGLKQRSRYVIATKRQKGDDATNLLEFEVGDLIVLMNQTTGKDLLTEKLVKQLFSKGEQMALDILNNNQVVVIQNNGRPHTLEQFAIDNFSREPMDVPLLKKLEGRDEQCRDAMTMFVCLLKYMGDQPSRRSRLGTDLTDSIFKPAIAHVYFPDQSDEAIEVESSTRARDFCRRIAQRLGLKKPDGFSLFVKIKEKVLAVPEGEFFFDFVRQLSDWVQNNHALKECPKYLLGYHKVSKQEAVEVAAIILRAITKDSKNAPLAQIPQLLSELVPSDMMKMTSTSEWKKAISSAYVKVEHMSSDQAKIEFLTIMSKKDSFGSAFFPVSQYSDLSLPDKLLIAINQKGVHLYNCETKTLITQGYKMDDLITSYISVLISGQNNHSNTRRNESII